MQAEIESITLVEVSCLNPDYCMILAEGFSSSSSLKRVSINCCSLDIHKLAALARGLKIHTLVSLSLANNGLEDDSIDIICSLLAWHYKERDAHK